MTQSVVPLRSTIELTLYTYKSTLIQSMPTLKPKTTPK
jgi:hypothetical protein